MMTESAGDADLIAYLKAENARLGRLLAERFLQLEKAEKELHALRMRSKHDRP